MMPQMDGEAEYRQSMIDMVNEGGIEALAKNWLPRLVHQSRHDVEISYANDFIWWHALFVPATLILIFLLIKFIKSSTQNTK
ncbi:MAG: hypothetical protein COB24_07545 [Hyphomicrobiales bacterium]|nr:MAG: hypothetical protein COB24_07545 [Hyphomicrobiales bacterium]